MIAARKKNPRPLLPRAKIARIVAGILPAGVELRTADSGIRQMKVVWIVTRAWKRLRPAHRISKVLTAMDGQLTAAQRERILRFSVLTPEEYKAVVEDRSSAAQRLR